MTEKIERRGGRREGAGRKPSSVLIEQRTVCLPAQTWRLIIEEAKRHNVSHSQLIADAIKAYLQ